MRFPLAPQAPERGRQIRGVSPRWGFSHRAGKIPPSRDGGKQTAAPLGANDARLSILPQSRTLSESLGYFSFAPRGAERAGRTRDPTLCCIIDQVSAPRKSCPPFACRSLIRLDPEIFLLCVHCVLCGSTLPRGEKTKKPQRARRTQRRVRFKARWSGPAAEIVGKRVTFNATRKCHQHSPSSSGLLAE